MLTFKDLISGHPGIQVPLDIPTEEAVTMMADAFAKAMVRSGWPSSDDLFRYFAPVSGLQGSCRIFANEPFPESVPMHTGLTPLGLALEFLTELCLEARFPEQPAWNGNRSCKCFEVRPTSHARRPAVLVLAGWKEH